ncbi:MAG: hypothetical protein D6765_15220 [Bacteroidetes bacterium]|nr:MAG: hypothetical protein D6765_15220 [Bacteroidota bacterium]
MLDSLQGGIRFNGDFYYFPFEEGVFGEHRFQATRLFEMGNHLSQGVVNLSIGEGWQGSVGLQDAGFGVHDVRHIFIRAIIFDFQLERFSS